MEIDYDYLHNALDRVEHTTTVDAFYHQFQAIQSLLVFLHPEIPESYLSLRFAYGLQAEFQPVVLRFNPTTIWAAYQLACIYEESIFLDYFPEPESQCEGMMTSDVVGESHLASLGGKDILADVVIEKSARESCQVLDKLDTTHVYESTELQVDISAHTSTLSVGKNAEAMLGDLGEINDVGAIVDELIAEPTISVEGSKSDIGEEDTISSIKSEVKSVVGVSPSIEYSVWTCADSAEVLHCSTVVILVNEVVGVPKQNLNDDSGFSWEPGPVLLVSAADGNIHIHSGSNSSVNLQSAKTSGMDSSLVVVTVDRDNMEVPKAVYAGTACRVAIQAVIRDILHVKYKGYTEQYVVAVVCRVFSMASLYFPVTIMASEQERSSFFCWEPGPLTSRYDPVIVIASTKRRSVIPPTIFRNHGTGNACAGCCLPLLVHSNLRHIVLLFSVDDMLATMVQLVVMYPMVRYNHSTSFAIDPGDGFRYTGHIQHVSNKGELNAWSVMVQKNFQDDAVICLIHVLLLTVLPIKDLFVSFRSLYKVTGIHHHVLWHTKHFPPSEQSCIIGIHWSLWYIFELQCYSYGVIIRVVNLSARGTTVVMNMINDMQLDESTRRKSTSAITLWVIAWGVSLSTFYGYTDVTESIGGNARSFFSMILCLNSTIKDQILRATEWRLLQSLLVMVVGPFSLGQASLLWHFSSIAWASFVKWFSWMIHGNNTANFICIGLPSKSYGMLNYVQWIDTLKSIQLRVLFFGFSHNVASSAFVYAIRRGLSESPSVYPETVPCFIKEGKIFFYTLQGRWCYDPGIVVEHPFTIVAIVTNNIWKIAWTVFGVKADSKVLLLHIHPILLVSNQSDDPMKLSQRTILFGYLLAYSFNPAGRVCVPYELHRCLTRSNYARQTVCAGCFSVASFGGQLFISGSINVVTQNGHASRSCTFCFDPGIPNILRVCRLPHDWRLSSALFRFFLQYILVYEWLGSTSSAMVYSVWQITSLGIPKALNVAGEEFQSVHDTFFDHVCLIVAKGHMIRLTQENGPLYDCRYHDISSGYTVYCEIGASVIFSNLGCIAEPALRALMKLGHTQTALVKANSAIAGSLFPDIGAHTRRPCYPDTILFVSYSATLLWLIAWTHRLQATTWPSPNLHYNCRRDAMTSIHFCFTYLSSI